MGPDRWRFVSWLFTPGWLTNVLAGPAEADAAQVSARRTPPLPLPDDRLASSRPPSSSTSIRSSIPTWRRRRKKKRKKKAYLFNNPPPGKISIFYLCFFFSSETLATQRFQNANWNCSALKKHRGFFIHAGMLCGESYCRTGDRQTASSMGRCSQR